MARTYKDNNGWRTDGNGISVWAETFGNVLRYSFPL